MNSVSDTKPNASLTPEQWEAALRAREEMLAIAAHELASPLAGLHLQIQLLRRLAHESGESPVPSEVVLGKAERMETQARRVTALLETLLDVSRLRNGQLVLERESVDLTAVTSAVILHLETQVPTQESRLSFDSPGPIVGQWDKLRLEQVLVNLISNAFKYGQGKPIAVGLCLTRWREEAAAEIRVTDEGAGVPAELREEIFRPFARGTEAHRRRSLGLGLYISRQIVQAHGGELAVEGGPSRGSTFRVLLPLRKN